MGETKKQRRAKKNINKKNGKIRKRKSKREKKTLRRKECEKLKNNKVRVKMHQSKNTPFFLCNFFGLYNIYFVFTNNTKISASRIYV